MTLCHCFRYYLRFKEIYRQAAYDVLLDDEMSPELNLLRSAKQSIPDAEEELLWIHVRVGALHLYTVDTTVLFFCSKKRKM